MIEAIIWYLFVVDCLIYTILTFTARWHHQETHHFWKGIPLHWIFVLLYVGLLAWLGSALYRLGVLF